MNKVLIIGSSGQASVIIDMVEKLGDFEIAGLIDDFRDKNEIVFGYKILGKLNDLPKIIKKYDTNSGLIAVGDNWSRSEVYERILNLDPKFEFVTVIHPNATIGKDVKIDSGSVIMAGVIVNSGSKIGKQCILNTKSSLDHDSIIDDFVSLAPGVTTGGHVHIRKMSAINIGATIVNKILIGKHTVIGAGSLVLNNIDDNVLAYGTPARIIRKRKISEPYF